MSQTIYASFADVILAEKAAGALMDYGVRREDLSLVANNPNGLRQEQEVGTFSGEPVGAFAEPTPAPAGVFAAAPLGAQYAAGSAATYAVMPNEPVGDDWRAVSTAPPYAPQAAARPDGSFAGTDLAEPYDGSRTDRYEVPLSTDNQDAEYAAKSGITTTTPEDAGEGAVKGTGIGLGLGLLAGLASLMIPGVGLVVGGGALAAALGGAALTAGAGAAAGGVVGYLKDQGVAETTAAAYDAHIRGGGALLAVNLPSANVDLQAAEAVLNKYGASDISSY